MEMTIPGDRGSRCKHCEKIIGAYSAGDSDCEEGEEDELSDVRSSVNELHLMRVSHQEAEYVSYNQSR